MRRKTATKVALLVSAIALAVSVGPAAAAITESTNNGHPNTTPSGKCPNGLNKDATNGALNKCD
jgi:hypothetical protein